MAVAARRIHMGMAAGELFLAALLAGIPTAGADPTVTLPAMTSTGGGPIIGGGDAAAQQRISLQLVSFKSPNVQEVDGLGRGSIRHGCSHILQPRPRDWIRVVAASVGMPNRQGRIWGAHLPTQRRA